MTDLGPVLFALSIQVALPLVGGLLLSWRRDPAAACGPLAVALAAAVVLTPLAFVPRPSWPTTPSAAPAANDVLTPTDRSSAASGAPGGVNVVDLLRMAKPVPVTEAPAETDPWTVIAWLALGLAAIGLGRFAVGWLAVARAVRRSIPVTDRGLTVVADGLRSALGCKRAVRLRESPDVGSAATTGWLRPIVLVSPEWRAWSADEVRAVLAHELAHVARGDFVTRLLGRFAVAVHGYHPLVRWAAGRLELRQEMAADARAAESCGGRPAYLKCLAALALKADAAPVGPVPTFLSRPRTLLRRIAMLRVTDDAPIRNRRWPALAGVAVLAAAALALHGTRPEALAGPVVRVKAEEVKHAPLDVSYVFPADDPHFVGVYAVRAGAMLATPGLDAMAGQYAAVIPAAFGEGKKMFFELKDIEQVCGRVSIKHEPEKPSPNRALLLSLSAVRMANDFDWAKQLREWCSDLKEHTRGPVKYYSGKMTTPVLGSVDSVLWFYQPDARTLVVEKEENLKQLIDGKDLPKKPLDWDKVEGGTLAVALVDPKTRLAKKIRPPADHKDETEKKVTAALADVFATADSAVMGVEIGKTCRATLSVSCTDSKDAEAAEARCQELKKLALDGLVAAEKVVGKLPTKSSCSTWHAVESGAKARHTIGIEVLCAGNLLELLGSVK